MFGRDAASSFETRRDRASDALLLRMKDCPARGLRRGAFCGRFVDPKPRGCGAGHKHMNGQSPKNERTDTRMSVHCEKTFGSVNAYRALNRMTSSRIHQIGLSHHQNMCYLRCFFNPRSAIQRMKRTELNSHSGAI